VKVNEFAIGMGPALLKLGKGETKYSLRALPFGGSVRMEGEDEESPDARSFLGQKPWKRFIILFAGAFINLICGFLIMVMLVSSLGGIHSTSVGEFAKNASTRQEGLREGDEFLRINGKRVLSNMDIFFLLSRDSDGIVELEVKRSGKTVRFERFAFPVQENEDGSRSPVQDFIPTFLQPTAGRVLQYSVRQSVTVARIVWLSLLDMMTGRFKLSDMSGPIGVVGILTNQAQEAQQSAAKNDSEALHYAVMNLLLLFSLISINIGIMNLLPIPALDGGRLFFCIAEMIFRKPIPKKLEAIIHGAGMILLLAFMVIISFSDIWALITGKR
jgi:regulator of sigma E protease